MKFTIVGDTLWIINLILGLQVSASSRPFQVHSSLSFRMVHDEFTAPDDGCELELHFCCQGEESDETENRKTSSNQTLIKGFRASSDEGSKSLQHRENSACLQHGASID